MSALGSDTDGRCPIAGRKRPAGASEAKVGPKIRRSTVRAPLRPIVNGATASKLDVDDEADSSSCCFHSGVSSESSLVPSISKQPPVSAAEESSVGGIPNGEFRQDTRSYFRRNKDSGSYRSSKRSKVGEDDDGKSVTAVKTSGAISVTSASASASEVGGGSPGDKRVSGSYLVEKKPNISAFINLDLISDGSGSKIEIERSQISQSSVTRADDPIDRDLESDFGCSERLSDDIDEQEKEMENEGSSDYSTGNEVSLSDVETELFGGSWEEDFTDECFSSDFAATSSSSGELFGRPRLGVSPSATFSLFQHLTQQFTLSSHLIDPQAQRKYSPEFTMMRFEDEEDEESYEMLRSRERAEMAVHDYTEDYGGATDLGDLIVEQRLVMVNWIVEHASAMDLQSETLFLGVSMMDRLLSRGYFKSERHLQVLGIACITLATRIEENQPYNSIRQISFKVKNNLYSKSEVVAMEWLVQEVLKFKCFAPTIHQFLWFYLKAAKADAEVKKLSRYLAVLSLLDHERLSFWPSSIAAGLVILACLVTNRDISCRLVMETHVRTKYDDLPESMQCLQWLVKYAC